MLRVEFETVHIDLSRPINDLTGSLSTNFRYEIRKANSIPFEHEAGRPEQGDKDYLDRFLISRGLGRANDRYLTPETNIATRMKIDGQILAVHIYKLDETYSRARLIYSASGIEVGTDNSTKRETANSDIDRRAALTANRYLHFKDLLLFKDLGIKTLDLGGLPSTRDASLAGIRAFKIAFGGKIVTEYNYVPIWLFGLERAVRLYRRIITNLKYTKKI